LFFRYYEAVIDEITTDGQVSVTFANYKSLGVTTLGLLKLSSSSGGAAGPSTGGNKKELLAKQKEYLKKRKQKKQERFKKLDQVNKYIMYIKITRDTTRAKTREVKNENIP
jgi:survival-of-motor-neuron-related-splicing factor 30